MSKIIGFGSTDSGGCGCSGRSMSGLGLSPDGLGISPDGLGNTAAPLGSSVVGNWFFDALLGAGLGYALAPSKRQGMVYAGAGAAAVGLGGTAGIVAAVAGALLVGKNKQR